MMLTPEFFDTLILTVMLVGGALALVRLYAQLRRPAPPPGAAPSDWQRGVPPQHDPKG